MAIALAASGAGAQAAGVVRETAAPRVTWAVDGADSAVEKITSKVGGPRALSFDYGIPVPQRATPTSYQGDSTAANSRSAHLRRGALTGTIIGFGVGALAGATLVETGCDLDSRHSCAPWKGRLSLGMTYGAAAALVGAAVGTITGALWPVAR